MFGWAQLIFPRSSDRVRVMPQWALQPERRRRPASALLTWSLRDSDSKSVRRRPHGPRAWPGHQHAGQCHRDGGRVGSIAGVANVGVPTGRSVKNKSARRRLIEQL